MPEFVTRQEFDEGIQELIGRIRSREFYTLHANFHRLHAVDELPIIEGGGHGTTGAGALWCPDHIVSDAWAAIVAAKNGVEGETVTTYQGETVRIWSTVAGVFAAAVDGDIMALCQATYQENVTLASGVNAHLITLAPNMGGDTDIDHAPVVMKGVNFVNSPTITIPASSSLSMRGIYFQWSTGQGAHLVESASSGMAYRIENCVFNVRANYAGLDLTNGLGVKEEIVNNHFTGQSDSTGVISGGGAGDTRSVIEGNVFETTVAIVTAVEEVIEGNFFIDSDISLSSVSNDVHIRNNYLYRSKIYPLGSTAMGQISIKNNDWTNNAVCIDFTSYAGDGIQVVGNYFNMDAASAGTFAIAGSGAVQTNWLISGNTVYTTSSDVGSLGPQVYDSGFPNTNGNWKTGNKLAYRVTAGLAGHTRHPGSFEFGVDDEGLGDPGWYIIENTGTGAPQLGWRAFTVRFGASIVSVSAGTTADLDSSSTYYAEVDNAGSLTVNKTGFTADQIPLAQFDVDGSTRVNNFVRKLALGFLAQTPGGSSPAPDDAQYLVLALDGDLSAERVFTPGTGLAGTDGGANGNYTLNVSALAILNEPTGFPNRTDSVLSFVSGTRTFTIGPSNGSFDYYQVGVKYTVSSPDDKIISDVSGTHFLHYDGATLTDSVNPSAAAFDTLMVDKVLVGLVYWNATDGAAYMLGDERHGAIMSGKTHEWLHDTIGAVWSGGLTLSGYTVDEPDSDASLTLYLTDGEFHDQDINHNIVDGTPANQYEQQLDGVADASIPVIYRDDVDSSWKEDAASTLPYKVGGTGRLAYNKDDGDGTFSQVEVTDGKWISATLVATSDWQYPIKMIQGQNEYTDKKTAIEEATAEIIAFGTLPSPELVILYRLVLQTKDSYGSTPNAQIVDVTDFRRSSVTGGAATAQDHGTLSGLGDDDHAHYLLADGSRPLSADWAAGAGYLITAKGLFDADKDTGIWVEKSADEDIIRFDVATVERLTLNSNLVGFFASSTARTACIDAETGHITAGGAASPSAHAVLSFVETFADPAAPKIGIAGAVQIGMVAGNNAQDVTGAKLIGQVATVGAARSHTGVAKGVEATATFVGGSGTELTGSDGRAVHAGLSLTYTTLAAGYGLYVADATMSNSTLTTQYGAYFEDLDSGGTNYGLYFAGTSGAARQGIWWNADTNLYRVAANVLMTDDSLRVALNIEIRSQGELRFYDNGNYVGFEAPALGADQIWVLPSADGNNLDVLQTNGSGALSWVAGSALSTVPNHDHTGDAGDGAQIAGASALSDIGISDNKMVQVDGPGAGAPANGEYAKWTANGVEGKAVAEVMGDLSDAATAEFGFNGQNVDGINSLYMDEQAAADADVAGEGQLWTKNATPNELWFTNDAGTDERIDGQIRILIHIDGGGSAITTGLKVFVPDMPACTITGWTLIADQAGSIVIDVWKDTYAAAPPTVGDTIAGSEKPTLSAVQKNQDLALGTWTTTVAAGDVLAFNVDSITTCEWVDLVIRATKA